ncbi:phosphate regulon transcriptional regulator PhoB [Dongshaea marina]|uniref:phosphate regulon transcriptional regulator PhoB n=1 Tax=Dongshaea marina TaxID=2047966 RepID=UPI000D3E1F61|nr:phosphate regulon transcriptional regulator PhoB [Dongshaea marina]
MTQKLLVVEDEPAIRDMLLFLLDGAGYQTSSAEDFDSALSLIKQQVPDLILLDWMLPGASGLELIRRLKESSWGRDLPVILLTARGEEEDKVRGLKCGADDYVTKPFSPNELLARIQAVLRRSNPTTAKDSIDLHGLSLDPEAHRVMSQQQEISLGPIEFKLLYYFMTHIDKVCSRERLLDRVWGNDVYVDERTVDVYIRRLRKTIAPYGYDKWIETVRGAGYRFSPKAGADA